MHQNGVVHLFVKSDELYAHGKVSVASTSGVASFLAGGRLHWPAMGDMPNLPSAVAAFPCVSIGRQSVGLLFISYHRDVVMSFWK